MLLYTNFSHVRFLQRYVQKETESMQSSKSNTATALASRKKKMAEICSLIKYFIRYANKRKIQYRNCSTMHKPISLCFVTVRGFH